MSLLNTVILFRMLWRWGESEQLDLYLKAAYVGAKLVTSSWCIQILLNSILLLKWQSVPFQVDRMDTTFSMYSTTASVFCLPDCLFQKCILWLSRFKKGSSKDCILYQYWNTSDTSKLCLPKNSPRKCRYDYIIHLCIHAPMISMM